ncbi:MAG: hypothetical protein GF320_21465 [Armatimonadia bacterium]|nr:hypothetical protein [Armatimonadia bacterium]
MAAVEPDEWGAYMPAHMVDEAVRQALEWWRTWSARSPLLAEDVLNNIVRRAITHQGFEVAVARRLMALTMARMRVPPRSVRLKRWIRRAS